MKQELISMVAALSLVVAVAVTQAEEIVIPHEFVNGEVADANDVNENFDVLVMESNDQNERIGAMEGRLHVTSVGSEGLANPGGTGDAFIVFSVNDADSPVSGLGVANLSLSTMSVPAGGSGSQINTLVSGGNAYALRISPAAATWKLGRYTYALTVTAGGKSFTTTVAVDVE